MGMFCWIALRGIDPGWLAFIGFWLVRQQTSSAPDDLDATMIMVLSSIGILYFP
jgi:hypothetical protein